MPFPHLELITAVLCALANLNICTYSFSLLAIWQGVVLPLLKNLKFFSVQLLKEKKTKKTQQKNLSNIDFCYFVNSNHLQCLGSD